MRLTFPSDAVVVVAGVPGAGKTTLIRRAVDRNAVGVVDTDDRREPGLRRADWRGFLYAGHYLRIAVAIAVRRPAVIHSRGTRPALRRLLVRSASRTRRRAARRAGRIAATTPAMTDTITKLMSAPVGDCELEVVLRERLCHQQGEEDPER